MIPSPILGGFGVGRSKNAEDSQITNLFLELIDGKDGAAPGFLQMAPGLDLNATLGTGPIRPGGLHPLGSSGMIAVSGNAVYSVTAGYAVTSVGTIGTSTAPVSIIDNGSQVVIFDGVAGWLTTAAIVAAGGGVPLSGGAIGPGSLGYALGDDITLLADDGVQDATAIVEVSGVGANGAVTSITITQPGLFSSKPSGFTQASTTGNGAGFTLTPTWGVSTSLIKVALPFEGSPGWATFQDGFGLVAVLDTQAFYQSALGDLSTWPALTFSTADASPDNIVAIKDIHREVIVFKSKHIEFWVNAGLAGFAFQRLDGVLPEAGTLAGAAIAKCGESFVWLGQTAQGTRQVLQLNGYVVRVVSTAAIEAQLAQYESVSDAVAYSYQQQGHLFYVLSLPSGNATWVLDLTQSEKGGLPLWHQRAAFANGVFSRHWAQTGAEFGTGTNTNIVGDFRNGNLYSLNLDQPLDNGVQRRWMRTWRALPKPTFQPVRFSCLTVGMETGIQVPDGTAPQLELRWSDDGGHNWSSSVIVPAGPTGATAQRVQFKRLGSTRRGTGLDRIFELSSADRFKVALIRAEVE